MDLTVQGERKEKHWAINSAEAATAQVLAPEKNSYLDGEPGEGLCRCSSFAKATKLNMNEEGAKGIKKGTRIVASFTSTLR